MVYGPIAKPSNGKSHAGELETDIVKASPAISVVVPVYNAARHLNEAITSISNQSFRDIEIILVNDGSVDGSGKIIHEWARKDSRIVAIQRGANLGLVRTLNEGLDIARGRYIARMDADDVSEGNRLATQLRYLEANAGIGVLGSQIEYIDDRGKQIHARAQKYSIESDEICFRMLFGSPFAHPTVCARSEILKRHRYEMPVALVGTVPGASEDYHLWARLAIAGIKFANTPDKLLRYRVNGSQYSQTYAAAQQYSTCEIAAQYANAMFGIPKAMTRRFGYGFTGAEDIPQQHAEAYVEEIIRLGIRLGIKPTVVRSALCDIAIRMPNDPTASGHILRLVTLRYPNLLSWRFVVGCGYKSLPRVRSRRMRAVLLSIARRLGFHA